MLKIMNKCGNRYIFSFFERCSIILDALDPGIVIFIFISRRSILLQRSIQEARFRIFSHTCHIHFSERLVKNSNVRPRFRTSGQMQNVQQTCRTSIEISNVRPEFRTFGRNSERQGRLRPGSSAPRASAYLYKIT